MTATENPGKAVGESAASDQGAEKDTPTQAILVSIYHLFCIIAAAALLVAAYTECLIFKDGVLRVIAYAASSGLAGGTLAASRWVVHSVRHRIYASDRLLWQITTPIHSAVFAAFALALGQTGLVIATDGTDPDTPGYTCLIISTSFLVGFASELFVKRLLDAAGALFGERDRIVDGNDTAPSKSTLETE